MFRESLLAEYDHEIAATRRMLAQVPVAAMDWRPHHDSRSFAELAAHLTEVLSWSAAILEYQSFDLSEVTTGWGKPGESEGPGEPGRLGKPGGPGEPGRPGKPGGQDASSGHVGAATAPSAVASPSAAPEPVTNRTSAIERFSLAAAETRRRLDKSDGELTATWVLRQDGREMFALPRAAAFRTFVLAHLVHHRGQLSVYLRLNDIAVPPIYGPTANSARPRQS